MRIRIGWSESSEDCVLYFHHAFKVVDLVFIGREAQSERFVGTLQEFLMLLLFFFFPIFFLLFIIYTHVQQLCSPSFVRPFFQPLSAHKDFCFFLYIYTQNHQKQFWLLVPLFLMAPSLSLSLLFELFHFILVFVFGVFLSLVFFGFLFFPHFFCILVAFFSEVLVVYEPSLLDILLLVFLFSLKLLFFVFHLLRWELFFFENIFKCWLLRPSRIYL